MQDIGNVYTGLMQAAGASAKVFELINREPKISNDGDKAPERLTGRLEFKNVSFSYPSRPESSVLKVCCNKTDLCKGSKNVHIREHSFII